MTSSYCPTPPVAMSQADQLMFLAESTGVAVGIGSVGRHAEEENREGLTVPTLLGVLNFSNILLGTWKTQWNTDVHPF